MTQFSIRVQLDGKLEHAVVGDIRGIAHEGEDPKEMLAAHDDVGHIFYGYAIVKVWNLFAGLGSLYYLDVGQATRRSGHPHVSVLTHKDPRFTYHISLNHSGTSNWFRRRTGIEP